MDKKQLQEELKAELDHIFGESEDNTELAAALAENDSENLSEVDPITAGGVAVAGGAMVASRVMARRRCKKKFPDMNSANFKACFKNELTLGQKKKFRDQDESSADEIALYEDILSEVDPITAGGVAVAGGAMVASRVMARRRCRKKFPDMKSANFKACFKNELTLGQKKKFRDQDESSIMKTYAIFYVSENDEFDTKKKLDMLNFIENADDSMIEDLFENGEIEAPPVELFMTEEKAIEMMEKAADLLMSEESASVTAGKEMIKTAKDYWKPKAHKAAVYVGGKLQKAGEHMPGGVEGLQGVSAAVAAAAALTAGVMAYRKHFSKAAKACKDAPDKKACMGQYKQKAMAAKIAAMSAGKAKCAKSKDPAACKAKIDAKIKAAKG